MFLRFADWFVYDVLGLSATTSLGEALNFFIYDVLKISFLLFAIVIAISFLRSYIDNDKLKKFIERQPKLLAHFFAALFGAITPFCSCSSIPIFIGFSEAQVPFGVSMSYLITSPMINEIAILVLASVVGWKITAIYIATGILVGVFGGMLIGKLGWDKYLQDYLLKKNTAKRGCCACSCSCGAGASRPTIAVRIKDAFEYATGLFKKIWPFILLGVGVGAFLHGYVPQEFFVKYMGTNNLFAVPLSVAVGIPLYADATTIIPIAQVLISKGAAIGSVLVFMMAVVALSLPEMVILSKVMKKELLIRFVGFMFVTFVLVGYFYNLVL